MTTRAKFLIELIDLTGNSTKLLELVCDLSKDVPEEKLKELITKIESK